MAITPKSLLILLLFTYIAVLTPQIEAQIADPRFPLTTDAIDWQLPMSMFGDEDEFGDSSVGFELDGEDEFGRRSLIWKRRHYFISYGALSANRVPCPPRSGRSYYTPNCFRAHGPVHPYTRGCSRITRCRR